MEYTPMWHDVWKHVTFELVVFVLLLSFGKDGDLWTSVWTGVVAYVVFYQIVEPFIVSTMYREKNKKQ